MGKKLVYQGAFLLPVVLYYSKFICGKKVISPGPAFSRYYYLRKRNLKNGGRMLNVGIADRKRYGKHSWLVRGNLADWYPSGLLVRLILRLLNALLMR